MLDYNTIYIKQEQGGYFAVDIEYNKTRLANSSFEELQLNNESFVRINLSTIINTKYFIDKKEKRQILLRGGSVHKVSRRVWKQF